MAAHSHYLTPALNPASRKKSIDFILSQLEKIEYDSIAFTGMSGAVLAPIISYLTGKHLIMVRKKGDNTHSDYDIESSSTICNRYVIIDDQSHSGKTIDRIVHKIEDSILTLSHDVNCVGIILYHPAPDLVCKKSPLNGVPLFSRA